MARAIYLSKDIAELRHIDMGLMVTARARPESVFNSRRGSNEIVGLVTRTELKIALHNDHLRRSLPGVAGLCDYGLTASRANIRLDEPADASATGPRGVRSGLLTPRRRI
jgi:hypothetical protein